MPFYEYRLCAFNATNSVKLHKPQNRNQSINPVLPLGELTERLPLFLARDDSFSIHLTGQKKEPLAIIMRATWLRRQLWKPCNHSRQIRSAAWRAVDAPPYTRTTGIIVFCFPTSPKSLPQKGDENQTTNIHNLWHIDIKKKAHHLYQKANKSTEMVYSRTFLKVGTRKERRLTLSSARMYV